MALSISQILAASYPAVLAEARKPTDNWSESAFMKKFEKMGFMKRVNFGPTIEIPLEWRMNQGAGFLASELEEAVLTKTDIITAASYSVAELSVPIVWSKKDEAMNPSENQIGTWNQCMISIFTPINVRIADRPYFK